MAIISNKNNYAIILANLKNPSPLSREGFDDEVPVGLHHLASLPPNPRLAQCEFLLLSPLRNPTSCGKEVSSTSKLS